MHVWGLCADGSLDSLLQDFSHTLEGREHITEYKSDLWDPAVRLESLLDVLKRVRLSAGWTDGVMGGCERGWLAG